MVSGAGRSRWIGRVWRGRGGTGAWEGPPWDAGAWEG